MSVSASRLGEVDLHLFAEGTHGRIYEQLGAHLGRRGNHDGVEFAVWAPNAASVSVVGDFNGWDGRLNPMRTLGSSGIWELFIPGVEQDARYKFELRTPEGELKAFSVQYHPEASPGPQDSFYLFEKFVGMMAK